MGKDIESWLSQPPPPGQFPNVEFLKPPFDLGMHNTSIPLAIPCNNEAPPYHTLPAFGYSGLPILEPGKLKEPQPHGCFYHLPHPRQGLIPNRTLHENLLPKIDLRGKFPTAVNDVCGEAKTPIATVGCAPKQFLVFDQTGNKTTMMFSSWSPKPTGFGNPLGGKLGIGSDEHHNSGPILTDESDDDHVTNESDDDHVTNEEGEMHEDSEEIDALLYSEDEGNYSDAEETSTGHSPSSMSAQEKDWFDEEDTDEVASSSGPPVKRQKLPESSSEVPSVTNAAIPVNPNRFLDYKDDAESSCAGGRPILSLPGSKRLRDEKIRETVSILQTIIPGVKGSKDAVMVLDEAIEYLRTLKFKAKSLGLSAQ